MAKSLPNMWFAIGNQIPGMVAHCTLDLSKCGGRSKFFYEYVQAIDVTAVYLNPSWLDKWDDENSRFINQFCEASWFFETFSPLEGQEGLARDKDGKLYITDYITHFQLSPARYSILALSNPTDKEHDWVHEWIDENEELHVLLKEPHMSNSRRLVLTGDDLRRVIWLYPAPLATVKDGIFEDHPENVAEIFGNPRLLTDDVLEYSGKRYNVMLFEHHSLGQSFSPLYFDSLEEFRQIMRDKGWKYIATGGENIDGDFRVDSKTTVAVEDVTLTYLFWADALAREFGFK
jgi:hypothetical protein